MQRYFAEVKQKYRCLLTCSVLHCVHENGIEKPRSRDLKCKYITQSNVGKEAIAGRDRFAQDHIHGRSFAGEIMNVFSWEIWLLIFSTFS